MNFVIDMEIVTNTYGDKKYYTWDDLILKVGIIDEWQELIYGKQQDAGRYCFGIKRNSEKNYSGSNRSSKYYQVVANSLAQLILKDLINNIPLTPKQEKVIQLIRKGSSVYMIQSKYGNKI